MSSSKSVAVVGATGLVGRTMLRVLEDRAFPVGELRLLASERSAGKRLPFRGRRVTVEALGEDSFDGIDIALFSAGGSLSRRLAPKAVATGAVVIDNSSAWRMERGVPLVVPEVNGEEVYRHRGIIANPNCSTIQLVVALKPLADRYGLERVVVSTYQAVSGAGGAALAQLEDELRGRKPRQRVFARTAAGNTLFHTVEEGDEASEEEIKIMRETRKILGLPKLPISATCIRIPTRIGHGESVNVELAKRATPDAVRKLLGASAGIVVMDEPERGHYPTVLEAEGRDEVFVGRIRRDASRPNTVNMWVVADNVRKGAATNAVQIAEMLL